jgi:hypothetical protein
LKVGSKAVVGNLFRFKADVTGNGRAREYAGDEPPLRSELFSADQMQQHGKALAGSHQLGPGRAPDKLLARLADNEGILLEVRNLLTEAVQANRRITPAGEWLLDNFYLIEEQIRTAKRHLPKGTAGSCHVCRPARRPDFRASTTSRWRRSPTAMDSWIRRVLAALWLPIRP